MNRFTCRFTLIQIVMVMAIILCAGLAMAGVIHSAVGALPLLAFGSVAIRDPFEMIRTLKMTATVDTVSGTCYLVNGRVVHAMNTVAANSANVFMIGGLIEYATSDTSAAWTSGDKLYWDDTAKMFTTTATGNTLCAMAAEDKTSTAATGMVLLIPTP